MSNANTDVKLAETTDAFSDSVSIATDSAKLRQEARHKVALVEGSTPHMSQETRALLRNRLRMVALLLFLGQRERDRTGVRSTQATLLVVREGIDAYRADHDGRCPATLATLKEEDYLQIQPLDAWGRQLLLICPGRRNKNSYDLFSHGPSGDARELDRVE